MKVIEVEGVGPAFAEKLSAAGITTTERLLQSGGSANGRKAIAEASGIDEGKILKWVNHCDLMRIKGVGSEFSDLLEAAGVDTVKELATRRVDNLYTKLVETNGARKLVRRIPTVAEVESWVNEAKTLPGAVSY